MSSVNFTQGIYSCVDTDITSQLKKIERLPDNFNCLRIVYRAASGRVGFDADEIGQILFGKLLKNAVAWDCQKNRLRSFSEIPSQDPYLFLASFGVPSIPTNIITYHKLNEALVSDISSVTNRIAQLPTIKRELLYTELLELLPQSETIVVWDMMGVEPLVITKNCNKFIAQLKAQCQKANVKFYNVETEDQLPEW